ncbi:uncharacterized protein LOC110456783 [Mizuhopecten yessoensis]|uniref:uncharacterized protein LOC110456783 n=1 Tax=Mizuhopecten yessoensis TaxID=6573 RepID=UPI000B45768D|nr:uncharacterized protein LOC110456783 [Mizuhopecten yessoensis]
MSAPKIDVFAAIFCSCLSVVSAEYCYAQEGYTDVFDGIYKYRTSSTYCYYDQYCCSGIYYVRCCSNVYDNSNITSYGLYIQSVGTIAGAVVGGLIGLGALIACLVCIGCVWRRKRRPGRVIRNPVNTTTTFTVAPQNVSPPGSYPAQPTYPQNAQYSPYPQYSQQPGGYNPAYTPDGQYIGGVNPPAVAPPVYATVVKTDPNAPPRF